MHEPPVTSYSHRFGQKMGHVSAIDMMTGALTDPFGTWETRRKCSKKNERNARRTRELAYNSHHIAKALKPGISKSKFCQ